MRINARLDETHSHKLDYLMQVTGDSVTEVIKRAIDVYFEQVQQSPSHALDILSRMGFIGSGHAAPDLSESYKKELSKDLDRKHGDC
jgi:hypothetical protein